MDARSINFRLLECLQVLVRERHVTRAAEELGISQPKLSSALARLRKITGNPLLVRTSTGMEPTRLALDLASQAGEFITNWNMILCSEETFVPETTERIFCIQTTDFLMHEVLADAFQEIQSLAPHASLSISTLSLSNMREALDTGEVDLAMGWLPNLPPDLIVSHLMSYPLCCVVRADHPRIRAELTYEGYLNERHVVLTFGSSTQPLLTERMIDSVLAQNEAKRKVAFYVPSFLALVDIVSKSDLLGIIPLPLAQEAANQGRLRYFEPPIELPHQNSTMVWHARTKNDPGHKWLRGMLRRAMQMKARSQPQLPSQMRNPQIS